MTASITAAVAGFKRDPGARLDAALIRDAAVAVGHRWRERTLDPVTTICLMLLQVLHGNCACRTLRHLAGMGFSVAAFCDARSRLPVDLFVHLAGALIARGRDVTREASLWLGHRVLLCDGTGISMPDAPALQKTFGQPGGAKPGCGFPVMHLLVLIDHATGLLVDLATGPWYAHDAGHVDRLHPSLREGDVLVGDRAFCSLRTWRCFRCRGFSGCSACISGSSPTSPSEERRAINGRRRDAKGRPRRAGSVRWGARINSSNTAARRARRSG